MYGHKFDSEKNRFDLLPSDALWLVTKVFTYGAKKYGARNWEKGMPFGRMFGALMRHLWQFWQGEDYDKESGFHHMAHAATCAIMLLTYCIRKNINKNIIDDREKNCAIKYKGDKK